VCTRHVNASTESSACCNTCSVSLNYASDMRRRNVLAGGAAAGSPELPRRVVQRLGVLSCHAVATSCRAGTDKALVEHHD